MTAFLANIIAIFIMVPVVCFVFIFIISKLITNQGKKSLHLSVDITTLFFILSVNFLSFVIWNQSFLLFIFLFAVVIMLIFTFIHWKRYNKIYLKKIIKHVWRLYFLIFTILYFLLIFYGMFYHAFANLI